jgi:type 1 glutamine amidotransferase
VFLIGENEYRTKETLPAFARAELAPRLIRSTIIHANPDDPNDFPGIQALAHADLLVVSVRRRALNDEQLGVVQEYLASGKPVIGIRTASHAFDSKNPPAGRQRWGAFDTEILGHKYQGHHGNKLPKAPPTRVTVQPEAAGHPILAGVEANDLRVWSHLYKVRSVAPTATVLMTGQVEGKPEVEPVALAWTRPSGPGARVFYTSLGDPLDFQFVFFQRMLLNAIFWVLDEPEPRHDSAPSSPQ